MPALGGWAWLTGTRGIKYVLMAGGSPALAPHKQIKVLKDMEKKDGVIHLPPRFQHGDEVEVTKGHLSGWFHGLYDGIDAEGKARVLYRMLGLEQSTSIELWKLRPYTPESEVA
jgi:transcription antitermination factor NusG